MTWMIVGFLVLLVALMIPILAIVLDSPAVRNLLEARHGSRPGTVARLHQQVAALEDQVDDLNRAIESLKEEQQFLHQLLEQPDRPAPRRLPPPS